MEKTAADFVVIGANFGDEGKGAVIEALVDSLIEGDSPDIQRPALVRYAGGSQAGHTIRPRSCRRPLITRNLGASLDVYPYFGPGFLLSPETLLAEQAERRELGYQVPALRFWPTATEYGGVPGHAREPRIIIPSDRFLNKQWEALRAHGSCGVGVGEAAQRHQRGLGIFALISAVTGAELPTADTSFPALLAQGTRHTNGSIRKLVTEMMRSHLYHSYMTERVDSFAATVPNGRAWSQRVLRTWGDICNEDHPAISAFAHALERLTDVDFFDLEPTNDAETTHRRSLFTPRHVIYESSQGLGLDREIGVLPHVTNAIVGAPTAPCDAEHAQLRHLIYVTRPYLTRHGNGPMFTPAFTSPLDLDPDKTETNVTNEWQGALRYAPLDLDQLTCRIHADIQRTLRMHMRYDAAAVPHVQPWLAATHLDLFERLHDGLPVVLEGKVVSVRSASQFCDLLYLATKLRVGISLAGHHKYVIDEAFAADMV